MRQRSRTRGRRIGPAVLAVSALLSLVLMPGTAQAASPPDRGLTATLDGRPLKLTSVADWYCDDFSYPVISCFSDPLSLSIRDAAILSTTGVTYVTIYDFTSYTGSYMQVSQDYPVLAYIGWNDRVSSFKGRNSLSGYFFTDWFYSGTYYQFCCNQNVPSLGAFDNTFSSVHQI
jgi:hypothetical protein